MSHNTSPSIPDCIQDRTVTPWDRLFHERPQPEPGSSRPVRLVLKNPWSFRCQGDQDAITQSLLELWPTLFDDVGASSTLLDDVGHQHYDALVHLIRYTLQHPLDPPYNDPVKYATVMAWIIVAQRELLATVLPHLRRDTERGYKIIADASQGGRIAQQKHQEKRSEIWARWDDEIIRLRREYPTWSKRSVAEQVARTCHAKPETIRAYMKRNRARLGL